MERTLDALLGAVGVALLANPLYLGELLVYPTAGDGFAIDALYFAAFAGLGFVLVFAALAAAVGLPGRVGLTAAVAAIALGSVVAFVAYEWLVTTVLYADPPAVITGYGHRETVVVATLGALVALGAAAGSRRWRVAIVAPLSLALGVEFYATGRFLPRLVVGDAFLLAFKADVLGIPLLGGLLYAAALALGLFVGRRAEDRVGGLRSGVAVA
ncbi:MAG: hypothetical protein ABEJ42_03640 [Halobacteriaceae archaeon]